MIAKEIQATTEYDSKIGTDYLIVQGHNKIGNPITNFEEGGFPEYLLKVK